ncbi:MAG TPA: hypothetical protein VFF40_03360 [Acidimicrobiia bacterium]|nr:hypothetical protein [Acidimicrobiia bacterium]
MATKNPDPSLELSDLAGTARTLDDWLTMFHLCLVVLPDRPAASEWRPVINSIFSVFGDADCTTAVCVTGNASIARRILGDDVTRSLVFTDPDRALVRSLGLTHLPAFVHLRQDTTLVAAAEGWNPPEWQAVADGLGKAMSWSVPQIAGRLAKAPGPALTPGWEVVAP